MTVFEPRSERQLSAFISAMGNIPYSKEPDVLRQKSRDFSWFSPILKAQLKDCVGDIVVTPRNEEEVVTIARACVALRLPVTIRGGGTGNYGQAVPLFGGVILDMSEIKTIGKLIDGAITVQPGAKMKDIEAICVRQGWELRLFPSTLRSATIGGFIAGGSTGVGAINFGFLADQGIASLRVATLEEKPKIFDITGSEVNNVHHAYGVNGIITEARVPLAPARNWVDVAVAFRDFMALAHFCQTISDDPMIETKLVTAVDWPIPSYFRTLAADFSEGEALGLMMITANSMNLFLSCLRSHNGRLAYEVNHAQAVANRQVPIYEYSWNHTTLQALKVNQSMTYLQTLFAAPDHLNDIARMIKMFGDEIFMHLEFVRQNGEVCCFGIQIIQYTTEDRLAEIISVYETYGHKVFNPHTYILEDGGMKRTDPGQLAFKRRVDPYGLLNPGKMRGWGSDEIRI